MFWKKLKILDFRYVHTESEFLSAIESHIATATNDGKIIPTLSIFDNSITIYNEQLIRYAGYSDCGDPRSIEITNLALELEWKSKRTDFDILPLIYEWNGELKYHECSKGIIKEVEIFHDPFPGLSKLSLKWYAVPIVSNMDLEIGGLRYHTAPFNGWYMETEIGVRNFTDTYRYNKLEDIAKAFQLDTNITSSYWRDRAMVEFNYALYHSFKRANVSIVDHYTAAKQFNVFEESEKHLGRAVTGKWSGLSPPLSPTLSHTYHLGYNDITLLPNFLHRNKRNECPFSP